MRRATVWPALFLVLALVPWAAAQGKRGPGKVTPATPAGPDEAAPDAKKAASALKADPAEWAPADALAYIGVANLDAACEQLKATTAYGELSDPATSAALAAVPQFGEMKRKFDKLSAELTKAVGAQPGQLKNPFGGPAMAFVRLGDGEQNPFEFGLAVAVTNPTDARQYYDGAIRSLESKGRHDTVSAEGAPIDFFSGPTEGAAPAPSGGKSGGRPRESAGGEGLSNFACTLTQDRLLVGSSPDVVRGLLEKRSDSLAETPAYKLLATRLRPAAGVRFVVDLSTALTRGREVAARRAGPAGGDKSILSGETVAGLDRLIGQIQFGASSFDFKLDCLLTLKSPRTGIAKLLALENRPTAPPAHISSDTCIYASFNMSPQELSEQLLPLAGAQGPQAAGLQQQLKTVPLDALRGPLTLSLAISGSGAKEPIQALLGLGLADGKKVSAYLSNQQPSGMGLKPREVKGTQFFDFPLTPQLALTLAPVKEQFYVGPSASVEAACEPPAQALATTAAWKRIARLVPEQSWLTLYMDGRKLIQGVKELSDNPDALEAGGLGSQIAGGLTMAVNAGPGGPDAALKTASQTIITASTTPDGVQFTIVQLKPEK